MTRIDGFRHERFEPLHDNTRQEFVEGVAEINRPKLIDQFRVGNFWDEDQVCVPPGWRNCEMLKNVLNNFNDARAQTRPVSLEKESVVAIWSRSL